MVGKVYIKRNANLTLCLTNCKTVGHAVKYTMKFRPRARDIVPVSKKANGKDVELARHLKYLLQNNENGIMGEVEIKGNIFFSDSEVRVPLPPDFHLCYRNLYTQLYGSFTWLICKIGGMDVRFMLRLSNLLVAENANDRIENTLEDMERTQNWNDEVRFENYAYFEHKYKKFRLNPSTWSNIFGTAKSKKKTGPKLTLVLCADLSAKLALPIPIIGPTGKGYRLSLYLKELAKTRRTEVKRGKATNAVIVSESGMEYPIYEEYFSDGSPVFQAMLQNPSFEEGRTKRVNLADVEDRVVECMITYLYYFDMSPFVKDLGLAVKMLEIAERFQIDGLTAGVVGLIRRRFCDEFTIEQAIQLFVVTRHLKHFESMTRKVFRILQCHQDKLQESQEFMDLFGNEPELGREMFKISIQSAIRYKH